MNQIAASVQPPSLSARQIGLTMGAEVTGMQIHGATTPELTMQFVSFLHRYRVVVVPEIELDPANLVAFSRRFGALEIHSRFENTLPTHPEVFCVGNVEQNGMKASFNRGVEQWHADSSYRPTPSDASLFYAEIVPDEGGDTLFADATAAWRALDPALQRRVEGLVAVHSLETLRMWGARHNPDRDPPDGDPNVNRQAAQFPPVRQPLVRTHPATGARSLYVCPAVISHIEGPDGGSMDQAESDALIETLIEHATQPRFVYRHRWRRGDLVMWDNRAVLHTASLFDHTRHRRLMYRTTVAGGAPILS